MPYKITWCNTCGNATDPRDGKCMCWALIAESLERYAAYDSDSAADRASFIWDGLGQEVRDQVHANEYADTHDAATYPMINRGNCERWYDTLDGEWYEVRSMVVRVSDGKPDRVEPVVQPSDTSCVHSPALDTWTVYASSGEYSVTAHHAGEAYGIWHAEQPDDFVLAIVADAMSPSLKIVDESDPSDDSDSDYACEMRAMEARTRAADAESPQQEVIWQCPGCTYRSIDTRDLADHLDINHN